MKFWQCKRRPPVGVHRDNEVLFIAEENCPDYPADSIRFRLPGSPK